ncbi:RIP metalloprotease RseP [Rhizobacter sp. SG703]|uniref:RIP metalloprotease RseP n=1 Tax=Rhizobacter sp. SG703 TaxID=2587140 RepID=UPI0014468DA4|nr:RIP metalloprotease RseP [Rhizobacter sp. SG703]NKI92402.1 regulator of sigma E protease [Rhizobacter sp. SG703]
MILAAKVIGFVVTLGILIVIHEYGHYRVARACGVKVLRFSIGFGRVLWRRQATPDSTEFVLSMLPLGGYVKMLDEREGPVAPGELSQAFNRKPLWQRAAVVAAGPIANLLLAVLFYSAAHWVGVEEPRAVLATPPAGSLAERAGLRAGDTVSAISRDGNDWDDVQSMNDLNWQLTQALLRTEKLQLRVADSRGHGAHAVTLDVDTLDTYDVTPETMARIGVAPLSAAVLGKMTPGGAGDRAGLRSGDRVLAIDGEPVPDANRMLLMIRANGADGESVAVPWRVQRGNQVIDLTVRPAVEMDGGQRVGRIGAGIAASYEMVTVRYGVWGGMTQAVQRTWDSSALTLKMLGRMLIGQASIKNLSGPITIADYAGKSMLLGPAYFLAFIAAVSVSLGVLNLLPLPILDGGHLMYYLFEAVTGRPLSDVWLERLQRGGVAIMLLMMSLALYNDVARQLGLH